tara:strand:+ start:526 stop:1260 length:735 start_codon:yes stop_codon:yes gene_type:complete
LSINLLNPFIKFASGGGGATIPSISNEYLHYDFAGEQSTITMDGSNRVSKVSDGFGTTERDLVQATSGNQPLFIANNVNDLGVVDFDGDRYMKTASGLTAISQPFSVFTLIEFGDQSSFQDAVVLDGHGASNRINHGNHFAIDKVRCNAGANLDTGTITGLDESNALLTCIYNGSSTDIRINGVSKVTGNVGSDSWAGVSCGTNSSNSVFWDQRMMEIAVYEKAVSGAELTEMENYFLDRWGLS